MQFSIDIGYKSLIHTGEELCGDKVETVNLDDSRILILADGMGSGIRANILATLTSKIIATMMKNRMPIDEVIGTIAKTLPISSVNNAAYSTFSIIQVYKNGMVYIAEYDNPECVLIRNGKIQKLPFFYRTIEGKEIREAFFLSQIGDSFTVMSDGCLYCGPDNVINYAWDWQAVAECIEDASKRTRTAEQMAARVDMVCGALYNDIPTDDVTVGVVKIVEDKVVNILTGPPQHPEDDSKMVGRFMEEPGIKIVSGGSTSKMVARVLRQDLITSLSNSLDSKIPPTAKIKGIDLVTEGVITLNRTVELLELYCKDDVSVEFFEELSVENGATRMACYLMEECTTVNLYIGKAINEESDKVLPFEVSARQNLIHRLEQVLNKMNKYVVCHYY